MVVGVQHNVPVSLPSRMTRYPLCRRLGGTRGRSVCVLKISPPPRMNRRTVQLVDGRRSDYDMPVYHCVYKGWNFNSGNYLFTTDTK